MRFVATAFLLSLVTSEAIRLSKLRDLIVGAVLFGAVSGAANAQLPGTSPSPSPDAVLKLSKLLAAKIKATGSQPVSSENTARAYAKLLEGERYLWRVKNPRGQRNAAVQQQNIRDARLALQEAVAANPRLAEAYTALAELAITAPPTDVDEAIELARLAVQIKNDNFCLLYTSPSPRDS